MTPENLFIKRSIWSRVFQQELADVRSFPAIAIDLGSGFMTFADYFSMVLLWIGWFKADLPNHWNESAMRLMACVLSTEAARRNRPHRRNG